MSEKELPYHIDRELSSFEDDINILKEHGFNPIAVTQLMFEETYVFETEEEAIKAHATLENCDNRLLCGWWYGRDYFMETVNDYEKENPDCRVKILWLVDE